ncbi:hypothetical protein [Pelagibacterium sediminicola]|uniref:hypothetical protein n=1 Tax=Pelagibacterium sediminicola TaxID=2248761 RepID=UPI000E31B807|nr:hypothetical protein [Pelagibacterium sediminicola]
MKRRSPGAAFFVSEAENQLDTDDPEKGKDQPAEGGSLLPSHWPTGMTTRAGSSGNTLSTVHAGRKAPGTHSDDTCMAASANTWTPREKCMAWMVDEAQYFLWVASTRGKHESR